MQIWGGNIFSGSNITTALATKKHLNGYNTYNVQGDYGGTKYIFGSWNEMGVIANGTVKGFASGTALGYAKNTNGTLTPNPYNGFYNRKNNTGDNPGGSKNTSFCTLSPLTFANNPCSGTAGSLGNSTTTNSTKDDKNSVKNKLVGDNNTSGNLTVGGETVKKGETKVIYTKGNITVSGDMIYEGADSGGYKTLEEMPKLVIYAGGDINISCNVNRIDGLLVAEGSGGVKTCYESNDSNSKLNSRQLTINGAVMASKLTANRTYGAATGANSIVPAEIINFDPNLYLWGNSGTSSESDGTGANLDTTYTKELAPRL